jgi:hypothetical protein
MSSKKRSFALRFFEMADLHNQIQRQGQQGGAPVLLAITGHQQQ